jgi:hypothetical protein
MFVGEKHVVDARIVLVHGLADEPQAQHAGIEIDVLQDVAGDGGDVVDTFELHEASGKGTAFRRAGSGFDAS